MSETFAATLFFGTIFVILAGIVFGIYLLVKKPKTKISSDEWLNNLNLPPEAIAIRRKEINKQTAKIFTKAWFLEYWRGQRSPFNAWFTWLFVGRFITKLIFFVPALALTPALASSSPLTSPYPLATISLLIVVILYTLMSAIILWKCAKNGRYIYLVRTISILYVAALFV